MSTIKLTGNTLSAYLGGGSFTNVGNAFTKAKKSTGGLITEVSSLIRKMDLASTATNLETSKQRTNNVKTREETKRGSLTLAYDKLDKLISDTGKIDTKVANKINERKDDFYKKYSYLKPECEKSKWDKAKDVVKNLWDGICDFGKAIADIAIDVANWCKEHWKAIATALIVIVAIVGLVVLSCIPGGGIIAGIIAGACWGAIIGAVFGGVSGGLQSVANGGSFWAGFEEGAFSGAITGAITGAIFGGIGGAGQILGKTIDCASKLGKAITVISKVSTVISLSMASFDLVALADLAINPKSNFIYDFNSKLHSNNFYNFAQLSISAISVFTGGMTKTMACFVAGTMILTANGLVAIENIKAGDVVIATNPDTMETAEKRVVETYIREDSKLIHIVVNGEEIITTETHPFYVNNKGFVEAGELKVGDELVDVNNNILLIEDYSVEITEEPTTVYNFQVEDFHTYFVGESVVLVHNTCTREQVVNQNRENGTKAQDARHNELIKTHPETKQEITIKPFGDDGVPVDYNVRVDEINNEFFNEVKASDTAPYTKNQKTGYVLIEKNGGIIRGKGKEGFEGGKILDPLPGFTTRNGITRSLAEDLKFIGGKK